MTTKEDWEFREQYFMDEAKRLEEKAADLRKEAFEFREAAAKARENQQKRKTRE